jgi:hypothetical protein
VISDQSRIVAVPDQVSSNLGDEAVILHLGSGTYYGLDPVGARIWNLLMERPRSVYEIRDVIVDEYDVEPGHCERDLRLLLEDLAQHGLIRATDAPGK